MCLVTSTLHLLCNAYIHSANIGFIILQVYWAHQLVAEVSSQLSKVSKNSVRFCCCLSNHLREELKAKNISSLLVVTVKNYISP